MRTLILVSVNIRKSIYSLMTKIDTSLNPIVKNIVGGGAMCIVGRPSVTLAFTATPCICFITLWTHCTCMYLYCLKSIIIIIQQYRHYIEEGMAGEERACVSIRSHSQQQHVKPGKIGLPKDRLQFGPVLQGSLFHCGTSDR